MCKFTVYVRKTQHYTAMHELQVLVIRLFNAYVGPKCPTTHRLVGRRPMVKLSASPLVLPAAGSRASQSRHVNGTIADIWSRPSLVHTEIKTRATAPRPIPFDHGVRRTSYFDSAHMNLNRFHRFLSHSLQQEIILLLEPAIFTELRVHGI